MIAIGDNDPKWEKEYEKLGTKAEHMMIGMKEMILHEFQLKIQINEKINPKKAGRKLSNYLKVMSLEAQTIAR